MSAAMPAWTIPIICVPVMHCHDAGCQAGRSFNEWLVDIDACTTLAEALAALRRAARDIGLDRRG